MGGDGVSYQVQVADVGGRWRELHPGRRYTLTAALNAFDAVVVLGIRGVRVLRRDRGRWVQVCAYWPRERVA